MKFTKLLALSALWLLGLGANAAELIERTAPDAPSPQVETASLDLDNPAEFVLGNYYVLYNVGAKQFFTEGNSWGTQMSLGDGANLSYFSLPAGKTIEDAALLFNNYSAAKSSWKLAFFDSATAMFVDLGSQANYYWQVIPAEGKEKTYHLQASPLNPNYNPTNNAGFVGAKKDAAAGSALEPFLDEEQWIDWQFISVPEWDAYGPLKALYDKSQELKALIEKAEAAGIDVDAAVTVYNDLTSTLEQIETEIAALDGALKDNIANATGQNPQDASMWIVNGTFDTIGDFHGWSKEGNQGFGAGGTTSTNAEVYGQSAFNIYQDIDVKYPGLYLFGVKGFYRAGSSDDSYRRWSEGSEEARLAHYYVTIGEETADVLIPNIFDDAPTAKPAHGKAMSSNGYWIPNTMADANEFFHQDNLYAVLVPVEVTAADVKARIGVKKVATSYDAWSIFDDFTLIFCGAGEDRYVGYAKTLASIYPNYAEGAATKSYLDAYNALKNNPTATDKASAEQYIANLKAAKAELDLNISLWKTFEDSVTYAKDFVQKFLDKGQEGVPAVAALNKYLSGKGTNATRMIENHVLTNDEIRAELTKLWQLVEAVKTGVDILPGTDMTDYLANPSFSDNTWDGWIRTTEGTNYLNVSEQCAEAWNSNKFDIYQEVPGMPVGVYEISTQGFYRYGRGQDAFDRFKRGEAPENSPVYIYMNANATSFMNVFNEPRQILEEAFYGNTNKAGYTGTYEGKDTTLYFPDGMSSAAVAFKNDMFVNSAYGAQVSTEDKMRFGVKGSSNQLGDSWVIFDNFKLTYWGKQADKVIPALEGAIAEMQNYRTGRVGSNVTAALAQAISDAQTALQTQSTDGEALFAALAALYDIKEMAQTSKEKLDSLADQVATLKLEITAADMATVLAPAQQLCDQIEQGLSEQTISDDDVPGLKEQVNTWIVNAKKCVSLNEALANLGDAMLEEASAIWMQKAGDLLEEVNNKIAQGTLTFDEIDDYIEQINLLISTQKMPEDMNLATDANPVNATAMLKTPKFSKWDEDLQKDVNSNDGWVIDGNCNFGNDELQKTALAVEFWHQIFDIHQDVLGLPVGVYEVRCNAMGGYDADNIKDSLVFYGNVLLKDEVVAVNNIVAKNKLDGLVANADTALIFTKVETVDPESGETITKWDHNGASQYIKVNLGETGDTLSVDTLWQPASMVSAVKFFNLPNKPYANSLFVKISEEGQVLRLGIGQQSNQIWPIIDDFQLIYYGASSTKQATGETYTAIEEVAAQDLEVVRTEFFTIGGMRTNSMKKGFAIMRQTMSDGSVVVKKVVLK